MHLVYLIEHKDGVRRLSTSYFFDDSSRHGASISPAMPPDFRFIAHATKRYPGELSSKGIGDTPAQGCLARARGARKAQDRTFHRRF